MAIPDYQSIMSPMLKFYGDNKAHSRKEVANKMAEYFKLTPDEIEANYASGVNSIFYHRVDWAVTYLKQAGLIESRERAIYLITKKGLDVLKENPEEINNKYLKRYPEFVNFLYRRGKIKTKADEGSGDNGVEPIDDTKSPYDLIEAGYKELKTSLSVNLITEVKKSDPLFFQYLVAELLTKIGYGGTLDDAISDIKSGADNGVDGIIKEDRLGLDLIYIQAKRWENPVGVAEVDRFIGTVGKKHAKKGVFITTSKFTREAEEAVKNLEAKIVLIDGDMLIDLMIEYNLGVSLEKSYIIKKIDYDYFQSQ